MLNEVVTGFLDKSGEEVQDDIPMIGIVGKSNVGPLSLFNIHHSEEC